MSTTVSYRTEFESCYIQRGELHAHRYRLEVTVDGPQRLEDYGRVIDFQKLASFVNRIKFDKTYLYSTHQTFQEKTLTDAMKGLEIPVLAFPGELSVEAFCAKIAEDLQDVLDQHTPGVRVIEVKLRETNDSFATWSIE